MNFDFAISYESFEVVNVEASLLFGSCRSINRVVPSHSPISEGVNPELVDKDELFDVPVVEKLNDLSVIVEQGYMLVGDSDIHAIYFDLADQLFFLCSL